MVSLLYRHSMCCQPSLSRELIHMNPKSTLFWKSGMWMWVSCEFCLDFSHDWEHFLVLTAGDYLLSFLCFLSRLLRLKCWIRVL